MSTLALTLVIPALLAATSGTVAAAAPVAAPAATRLCGTGVAPPAVYDHVIWIWMENRSFDEVIGNADAPYETRLAKQCATAKRYADVGDPSLPNYIGATSGSTQGIHDDAEPADHRLEVDNLFRQVRERGLTEKSYLEGMSRNCQLVSDGDYAARHNPAAYYRGGHDRAACRSTVVPLGSTRDGALRRDLDAGTLPAFAFIVPNVCNSTHDCDVQTGDRWLRKWLQLMLESTSYTSGRTAIFVAWDENTPTPFIAISPSTGAGTVVRTRIDHYSLLRATEEMLGIGTLLGGARDAQDLRPLVGM